MKGVAVNGKRTNGDARHFDSDAGGGSSRRNRIRFDPATDDPRVGLPDALGVVRPRIEDLRAAAELARAVEPPPVRRLILDFAIGTGWSVGDVERLTFGDMLYVTRKMQDRLIEQQRRQRGTRR